jgi:hypothetical protein
MNVLQTAAPTGQVYEIQTTTQGTLLAEAVAGGGGGSTIVTPLANIFWILQSSTAGGGAAVATDAPSGAFSTFAAALAAATNGVAVTLFVGPGDYSAEGLQDFGAKGVPFLNVYGLSGAAGFAEDAGVIIPALDCDNMVLDGVQLGGTGTTTCVSSLSARNVSFETTGGLTVGNAVLDDCVLGGGAIDISEAALTRCTFSSDVGAISDISGWNVDSSTAAQLGNSPANGHFNSSTSVELNGSPCKLMHDANTGLVLADFSQVLVLNEFTAPRVLTVDLTGSASLDTLTVLTYADVAGGNTLTVNGTVLDRDNYTTVFQNQSATLVPFAAERAPTE